MITNEMFIGTRTTDSEPLLINRDDLTTHGVVVGRTGSGKTGLIHVIIEEAVMQGASAVVIDPKGDLANLLLSFPGLTPSEFAPWVPAGKNPYDEATLWSDGLKSTGQELTRVADWRNAATFQVFTPGYTKSGQAINLLPDLSPSDNGNARERAAHLVSTVLNAIGVDTDPLTDPSHVYLTELLVSAWSRGENLSLDKWAGLLVNPPIEFSNIDGIDISDFFPAKDRMKIARSLVGFRRQAARWLEGSTIDMNAFLMPGDDGRPRVSVFSLRHLGEEDRQMFVSMFLSGLVDWMFKAPASGRLRALCVLDEAKDYLPPHPYTPPAKGPLNKLLSQGRAQGLGVVLGTQNPNDLDYKSLSNVGTWFLGGLTDRDTKRDLDSMLRIRNVNSDILLDLPARSFLALTKAGESCVFKPRWTLSYLAGPLDIEQLGSLNASAPVFESSEFPKLGGKSFDRSQAMYGYINIRFDLEHEFSKRFDVDVCFSTDNGTTWNKATLAPEASEMINLESSPKGIRYEFLWDSVTDLGENFVPKVLTLVKVSDGNGTIMPPFDICNHLLKEEDPSRTW